jgi:hypothetical protein
VRAGREGKASQPTFPRYTLKFAARGWENQNTTSRATSGRTHRHCAHLQVVVQLQLVCLQELDLGHEVLDDRGHVPLRQDCAARNEAIGDDLRRKAEEWGSDAVKHTRTGNAGLHASTAHALHDHYAVLRAMRCGRQRKRERQDACAGRVQGTSRQGQKSAPPCTPKSPALTFSWNASNSGKDRMNLPVLPDSYVTPMLNICDVHMPRDSRNSEATRRDKRSWHANPVPAHPMCHLRVDTQQWLLRRGHGGPTAPPSQTCLQAATCGRDTSCNHGCRCVPAGIPARFARTRRRR